MEKKGYLTAGLCCLFLRLGLAGDLKSDNQIGRVQRTFSARPILKNLFTPIGFSKNKMFAYFTGYNCLQESGLTCAGDLKVVNLIDDSVVFEKHYEDSLNDEEIEGILRKYKIEQRDYALQQFPLSNQNDSFTAKIEQMVGSHQKAHYKLWLDSNLHGSKLISEADEKDFRGPEMESIVGLIKSPFEERIVILVHGYGDSFEGCQDRFIKPFGAHLNLGFKK